MDRFGFSAGSSSSGFQGGEGSSGSGQNPNNNKGFKRPIEADDSNSNRERKKLRPTIIQGALPEDTPLNEKASVMGPWVKRSIINEIFDRLDLNYGSMTNKEKEYFVQDFEKALKKWDNNYKDLTLRDAAIMKMGFFQYSYFFCDQSKSYLKNMVTDKPLDNANGYQGDFFRSRKDSAVARVEADNLAYFMRFHLITLDTLKQENKNNP